jgi:hypothetical protein
VGRWRRLWVTLHGRSVSAQGQRRRQPGAGSGDPRRGNEKLVGSSIHCEFPDTLNYLSESVRQNWKRLSFPEKLAAYSVASEAADRAIGQAGQFACYSHSLDNHGAIAQ